MISPTGMPCVPGQKKKQKAPGILAIRKNQTTNEFAFLFSVSGS